MRKNILCFTYWDILSSSPSKRTSALSSAGERCSVLCEDGSFTSRASSYKFGEGRGGGGEGGGEERGGEERGGEGRRGDGGKEVEKRERRVRQREMVGETRGEPEGRGMKADSRQRPMVYKITHITITMVLSFIIL